MSATYLSWCSQCRTFVEASASMPITLCLVCSAPLRVASVAHWLMEGSSEQTTKLRILMNAKTS